MAVNKRKIIIIMLSIVLIGLIAFYYGLKYSAEKNKTKILEEISRTTETAVVTEVKTEEVTVYIYDNQKNGLVKKVESIEKSADSHEKIKRVFELLKAESKECFDANAKILNVYFEDGGKVYLNFNRDFINPSFSNDVKVSILYSLVNTVCSMGYSKVKIMIENEDVNILGESINAAGFFEKDPFLIKGE